MRRALLLAVTLLLGGCSRGTALDGACDGDGGCPPGTRCVTATAVCVKFLTPLDPILDGGAPDRD